MEPSHRGLQVKNAHLSADGRASFAGSAVAILAVLDEAPHLQGGFRELPGIRRSEDPKAYLLLPAAQASARTQAVSIHPASPGSRPATGETYARLCLLHPPPFSLLATEYSVAWGTPMLISGVLPVPLAADVEATGGLGSGCCATFQSAPCDAVWFGSV